MYRFMILLATCTAVLLPSNAVRAAECCDGVVNTTCPRCKSCCTLKVECGKQEKHCWEIECETICIPRVVFPWQVKRAKANGQCCNSCATGCDSCDAGCGSCGKSCLKCTCVNNGARVKKVKKLKKKKYECPACKYEWTPACNCCGNGCGNGCGDPGCDSGCDAPGCDAPAQGAAPQQPAAAPPAPQGFYSPVPAPLPSTVGSYPFTQINATQGATTTRRSLSDAK